MFRRKKVIKIFTQRNCLRKIFFDTKRDRFFSNPKEFTGEVRSKNWPEVEVRVDTAFLTSVPQESVSPSPPGSEIRKIGSRGEPQEKDK